MKYAIIETVSECASIRRQSLRNRGQQHYDYYGMIEADSPEIAVVNAAMRLDTLSQNLFMDDDGNRMTRGSGSLAWEDGDVTIDLGDSYISAVEFESDEYMELPDAVREGCERIRL